VLPVFGEEVVETPAARRDHRGTARRPCLPSSVGGLESADRLNGVPAVLDALALHRRMRAPFCTAATQLVCGRLLLLNDPGRATPLLTSAADLAARHGYRYLQRSAP
jgi:hypothetical protein